MCEKEIVELHQFFQDWFNGAILNNDVTFARFKEVIDPSFAIISPAGKLTTYDDLLSGLREAYAHSEQNPGRIWIENVVVRQKEAAFVLATYEEWQSFNDVTNGRLSTVIFIPSSNSPNGLRWRHVHETWLPV